MAVVSDQRLMPAEPRRHQWHMRFDRVVCRDCDAIEGVDDDPPCPGTRKIRPQATIRQQQEGARDVDR